MTNHVMLHQYLDAELIDIQASISSSKKLIQEMAKLLCKPFADKIEEKEIYHLLLEREKLGNTGIGNGVALPHSRCHCIDKAVLAIITLDKAIDYDSLDRTPVDVAFGLLVPESATQEHLQILSNIAKFLCSDNNKLKLSRSKSPDEIIEQIKLWRL